MARTLDARVDEAIAAATFRLLTEHGFARLTIEGVAKASEVGKPAIYRRFANKVTLVLHVISARLPELEVPDLGDTGAELRLAVERGLPADGPSYVGLIGGLIAEQDRHPELIDGFRRHVLLPRRAIVRSVIERGQARGDIRPDLDPEQGIDLMAGSFLARAFAGLDTGPAWRAAAFATWWDIVEERSTDA
ncbi:MAG: TetR/AcrR family transcriptional regulator [Solirubrobacteraceae bacterium]